MAAAGLVQIVIQVRAGRDETVDVAVLDQIRDHHAQAAGTERAGHPHEDRHVVGEHLLPDAMRDAERAPLKRNALHLFEKLVGLELRIDGERLDRHLQEARALFHAKTILARDISQKAEIDLRRQADAA